MAELLSRPYLWRRQLRRSKMHADVAAQAAVVSRPSLRSDDPASYLQLSPEGRASWTTDPQSATPFASMREAMRAAMRLPAALKAFGLLREVEVALHIAH